jgi:DNA-directed RNA polymerase specialized sigma24 family protein
VTRRVQEPDASELGACYRSLSRELWKYALLVTRDGPLAEDLVQEAFQSAGLQWAKFRDLTNAERLVRLKAITKNKAGDAYRPACPPGPMILRWPASPTLAFWP